MYTKFYMGLQSHIELSIIIGIIIIIRIILILLLIIIIVCCAGTSDAWKKLKKSKKVEKVEKSWKSWKILLVPIWWVGVTIIVFSPLSPNPYLPSETPYRNNNNNNNNNNTNTNA